MSVSINDVRVATRVHLETIANNIETDYEGDTFTPTNEVEYQSVHLLIGAIDDFTIAHADSSTHNYILQVTLRYPTNKGTYKVETKASEIVAHFDRGLLLERNGLKIRVEKTPEVVNLGVEGDREVRAVSIGLVVYA